MGMSEVLFFQSKIHYNMAPIPNDAVFYSSEYNAIRFLQSTQSVNILTEKKKVFIGHI